MLEKNGSKQGGARQIQTDKIYSAGIYARLSVDSHNEKNESIETQIRIAKNFLEQRTDMVLYGCYSDLGRSGTNFDREGFQRLMADVRMRRVDCIIVKDFSRFGRNYIETGNYIQKIFPFLGVRFISVTDCFDSLSGDGEELDVNLKNLVNEMYAKDIGLKVKNARKVQWEMGSYTGGIPPYGYRVEQIGGRKQLLAEETTSELVREMYRLYGEGRSLKELAEWLYKKKVHRPRDYRCQGHVFQEEGEVLREWSRGSVKMILTNPVYMGCLVQARTSGKEYGMRKKHDIASGDWSVKENTHEALVTQEEFFRIAERFEKQEKYGNRDGFSKTVPREEDIFAGIFYCGNCGCRMKRISSVKELSSGDRIRIYGYCCRNSSGINSLEMKSSEMKSSEEKSSEMKSSEMKSSEMKSSEEKSSEEKSLEINSMEMNFSDMNTSGTVSGGRNHLPCKKMYISKHMLSVLVKEVLRREFAFSGIRPEDLAECSQGAVGAGKKRGERKQAELERRIAYRDCQSSDWYLRYRSGEISRENYKEWKEENERQIRLLKEKQSLVRNELQKMEAAAEEQRAFLKAMVKCGPETELTKEVLGTLIENIKIFPQKKIQIAFRYGRQEFEFIRRAEGDGNDGQTI